MPTDDYTLAILPLARLVSEGKGVGQCLASAGYDQASRRVLQSGVLAYQLYCYHGLVRERYGLDVECRVCKRHIGMFSHVCELAPMLKMIDGAVKIGSVITPTALSDVVTQVEMNVALALLLGLPGSPHYVTEAGQRLAQIGRMVPEIDWCLADCLARARQGMTKAFAALAGIPVAVTGKHKQSAEECSNE